MVFSIAKAIGSRRSLIIFFGKCQGRKLKTTQSDCLHEKNKDAKWHFLGDNSSNAKQFFDKYNTAKLLVYLKVSCYTN